MKSKDVSEAHSPIAVSNCHKFVLTRSENEGVLTVANITIEISDKVTQPVAHSLLTDAVCTWLHETPQGQSALSARGGNFSLSNIFEHQDDSALRTVLAENGITSLKASLAPQRDA